MWEGQNGVDGFREFPDGVSLAGRGGLRAMNGMQKTQRAAALERMIQQYEKNRAELTLLDQQLRASADTEELDDILDLNAQSIESATRSLHVAYARLEREQTRAVSSPVRSAPAFAPRLSVAM
jgi:hypothetical protein